MRVLARARAIEPEWVIAYRDHGMSVKRIADLTKRHPLTIRRGLERAGVDIRGRKTSALPPGPDLLEMRTRMSVAEIAAEHSVSPGYVRSALARAKRKHPKKLRGFTTVRCSGCGKRLMAKSVSMPVYCPRCTANLEKG